MVRFRMLLLLAALAGVFAVAYFVFGVFDTPSETSPDTVTLLLFDISQSTSGVRKQYLAVVKQKILPTAKKEGLLIGDIIDDNPLAHSTTSLPVEHYFERFNATTHSRADFEEDQRAGVDEVEREIETLLARASLGRGSAILDALNLAERVYAAYPSAQRRHLVILSDMVEESDRYSFTADSLRPKRVRMFISRERREGALADLAQVETYVVGAGLTGIGDPRPARIQAVRRFWLSYLAATGANLPESRYGPTLIRFP